MKLILTESEVQELYKFTSGLHNTTANKIFNNIFTQNHNEMIQQKVNNQEKTLELNIDEDISKVFLEAFVKNSSNISSLFSSNKLSLLCNAKTVLEKLSTDIITAISVAKRIWSNK